MGDSQSTTCIANGFVEEIQARVSVNKALYRRAIQEGGSNLKVSAGGQGVGIGAHGKTDIEYEHLQQLPGFVLIPPNDYLAFPMSGMDGQVFVTISAGKRNIANNYPVQNGRSIIIDANGYIKNAKPGKIWRDERGRKYSVKEPPAIKPAENEKIEDKKETEKIEDKKEITENEKKVENNNDKKEEIEEESNNAGDYITLPRPGSRKPRRKARKSNTRKEKVEKEKKTKDEKDEKEDEKEKEEEEEEEKEEEEEEDEEEEEEEVEEEEQEEEEEQDQNEEEEESMPEGKGIKLTSFFDFFSKRSVSN